jgi:ABC-2 type transport system permease protein
MLASLVYIELQKIARRPRTYIGFVAIALLTIIFQFAFYVDGERYISFATNMLSAGFIFSGNLLNGYLITNTILNGLIIHVPLLIALVAGELMSGEAVSGTIRFLITRPITRTQILIAKYLAACIYTTAIVIWLCIVSLGIGCLFFGRGELLILKTDQIIILASNDVLWRLIGAFIFSILSMCTVAALAIMLSTYLDNVISPIVLTLVIIIVFLIISNLNITLSNTIKPFLFTTPMNGWKEFFEEEVSWTNLLSSSAILITYISLFIGMSIYKFKHKNILS